MNRMIEITLFGIAGDEQAKTSRRKDHCEPVFPEESAQFLSLAWKLGHEGKGKQLLRAFFTEQAAVLVLSMSKNNYWFWELIKTVAINHGSSSQATVGDVRSAMESIVSAAELQLDVSKPVDELSALEACQRIASGVLLLNAQEDKAELVFNPIFQFCKKRIV